MISISNLGKSYGGRTLFEGVSLQLNAGSRYGLVGANGSGKTTFLKILAGDEALTDGNVAISRDVRLGVLRQDRFLDDDKIILDHAMMGEEKVWRALQERNQIVDHGQGDPHRLHELEDILLHFDGYTLEARATSVLEGLGIPIESHRLPLSTLSGGFKLRVLLAQVLIGGPDALLLDEPTNHLDILSIRWLEKFLAEYRGVALVISHDQRFLDNVVTHILDVDYETIRQYTGNYHSFLAQKEAIRTQQEAGIARQERIIAEKKAFVDRFGAKASKAKQAQSRLKQIERIEVEELKNSSRRAPAFRFTPARQSGRDVLEIKGLCKAYGDNEVLRDVAFTMRRGEKVAVIGPNGLGKSTLVKIVSERVKADSGTVKLGHEVRIGYFAQDHHENLSNAKMTPLDYIWEACPQEGVWQVRSQLGRMLFSGDDVMKAIGTLSGGEAARLIFGRIIVEKPNFLILDEPTNHLDLETIGALAEALKAYEGTLLFVSHDRWFVSEVATRIIELTQKGPRDFPGTYTEYLERSGDDHLDVEAVSAKSKAKRAGSEKTAAQTPEPTAISKDEKRRQRDHLTALTRQRDKLLKQISAAESRKQEIMDLYAAPDFYRKTSDADIAALGKETTDLTKKLESWLAEWEAKEKALAST